MLWFFTPYNKSFIDQACLVEMAGYWPRSFFAQKKKENYMVARTYEFYFLEPKTINHFTQLLYSYIKHCFCPIKNKIIHVAM